MTPQLQSVEMSSLEPALNPPEMTCYTRDIPLCVWRRSAEAEGQFEFAYTLALPVLFLLRPTTLGALGPFSRHQACLVKAPPQKAKKHLPTHSLYVFESGL